MEKELKKRLNTLKRLGELIQSKKGQFLTREQNAKIQEQQDRLEFRLKELALKAKLDEADIKIAAFEETLSIITNVPIQ